MSKDKLFYSYLGAWNSNILEYSKFFPNSILLHKRKKAIINNGLIYGGVGSLPIVYGYDHDVVGVWTGNSDDITEYIEGMSIIYVPGVEGSINTTLDINGLGSRNILINNANLAKQYKAGCPIILVYIKGVWRISDYYTNDVNLINETTSTSSYYLTMTNQKSGELYSYSNAKLYFQNETLYSTRFNGSLTGNASSADKFSQGKKINGTTFDNTIDITTTYWGNERKFSISDNSSTYCGSYVSVHGDKDITIKLPSNIVAEKFFGSFIGPLSGNVTGNVTGNVSGNAGTATKLKNSHTLWGQTFDGTQDVSGDISNTGNIIPSEDLTYNIGLTTSRYNNIYASRLIGRADTVTSSKDNTTKIYFVGVTGANQALKFDENIYTSTTSGNLHSSRLYINTSTENINYRFYTTGDGYISGKLVVNGDDGITSKKFVKEGSNNTYVLLGGGGQLLLSELFSGDDVSLYTGGDGNLTQNVAATNGNVHLTLKSKSTYYKHNLVGSNGIEITSDANGKITFKNTALLTQYTTGLFIGESTTKANKSITDPYLKLFDDNTLRNQYQIKGGSNVTITSDANGNIIISSSYSDTHWTSNLYVGTKDTKTNDTSSTNGGTWLKLVENNTIRATQVNLVGTGIATVTNDASGKISINVPNTNSHYSTGFFIGESTTKANKAITNPYLKIFDDNTLRGEHQLIGGSNVTITSDSNGHITIDSSYVNTDTHWTGNLRLGTKDTLTTAATSNGSTYLKFTENGSVRADQILIKGTGITTVSSDANGVLTINTNNPNTHYTTTLFVGEKDTKANKAITSPYIKLFDDNTLRSQYLITGGNDITVTSDANGNITIDNNYTAMGTFLPLVGGQMKGNITWKDSTALPENTTPEYFLTITAFASGGNTKWASKANTLKALTGLTSTAIGSSSTPIYWDGSKFVTSTSIHEATTGFYIGEATTKANKNITNPYLKIFDDNTLRNQYQVKGGSNVSVTSDANGNITIASSYSDTHWTGNLHLGAKDTITTAATSNGSTYLKFVENNTLRSNQILIKGTGCVSVSSDANGVLTINGVDTDTHYTTSLYIGEVDTKANKAIISPYIKIFDNNTLRNQYQFKGGTGISVASDANGNVTITNTAPDTDTKVNQSETTTSNWRGIVLGYNDNGNANTGISGNVTNVVYTSNKLTFQPSTGNISTQGNIIFDSSHGIQQKQADTSNATVAITWLKGGTGWKKSDGTLYTSQPGISQHNTGDTTGAITILPYATDTNFWVGSVGLYIGKTVLKWENNTILHSSNYTSYVDYYIYIGEANTNSNKATTNPYIKLYNLSTKKSQHQVKGNNNITVTSDASGNITIQDTLTYLYVGSSNTASHAAVTSNPYIKLYDGSTRRSEVQIKGSGGTTVSSDASGNITISSGTTSHTHQIKINGTTYTIPYTGAVDIGDYLKRELADGTKALDDTNFGNNAIIGTINGNTYTGNNGKGLDNRSVILHFSGGKYTGHWNQIYINSGSMAFRTEDHKAWWELLHSGNSSVSGGGSSWGSSITVTINNVTKTLTIPSNPNTDYKVTQNLDSSNTEYRLLFKYTANDSNETTTVKYNTKFRYNPSTGNIFNNGNFYIDTADNDRFIQFRYNSNNYAGAAWRLISRGSGSGDTNYFDIETGGSDASTNTWYRVIRLTMDNRYVGIGTDSPSSKLHVNGGLLKITNNSNTVTIGSANSSWCHFENSADIPFYFNKAVHVNGDIRLYNGTAWIQSSNGHIYANGYHHRSHDNDNALLLAGGGWKLLSDLAVSAHTHKIKLGGTEITIPASGMNTYTGISGPFYVDTNADSNKAFSIRRSSDGEGVKHWVDDSQYHIDYTNDETSSSIHIRIINTDTESPHDPRQTTDYHYYLDCYGNIYPGSNNTGSIGISSYKWANMYATTFHGSLDGNASTSTKLQTARNLKVNLASSASQLFDGSADATSIGISGTLPFGNLPTIYWANIQVSSSSNTGTTPQFGYVGIGRAPSNTASLGRLVFPVNDVAINFRADHSSYYSKVQYMTTGNEALVFSNKNAVTSFIFKCGYDLGNGSDWRSSVIGTPSVQIKNQSLYVNTAIADGSTPTYKFQVTGSTYINSNGEGAVLITGTASNYREGLRISSCSGWSDIMLCGTDATHASGTSAKSWFIGNNDGNFHITKNGSTTGNAYLSNRDNKWYFNTTSGGEVLNVGGWINTVGSCGWYNSTYGGGLYMKDSTYVRVYNGKYLYTTYQYYDVANENYTIDHVYASNDRFIRPMEINTFVSKITPLINNNDTVTFTKSLKVTEAWIDTGITTETGSGKNFPQGNGTYVVQISHDSLTTPGTNGYASIYSGIITIYNGTNATDQSEEIILHRSGHAWVKRLYLRTVQTASSTGYCKIQISASSNWTENSNVTFKFRKLI